MSPLARIIRALCCSHHACAFPSLNLLLLNRTRRSTCAALDPCVAIVKNTPGSTSSTHSLVAVAAESGVRVGTTTTLGAGVAA